MIKKLAAFGAAATIFAFSALPAFASGPAPGTPPYPWSLCPDSSAGTDLTCAPQLGSDLNPGNGFLDCTAQNGKAGIGLINFDSGKAHCFAL